VPAVRRIVDGPVPVVYSRGCFVERMVQMLRIARRHVVAPALALTLALPAVAQQTEPELKEEIEALKQGQQQIRKELAEIKQLLQAQRRPTAPAGPNVKDKVFELGANPVKGEQTAKLTLVEFTDYQ